MLNYTPPPVCWMMIGVPGCGKSSWISNNIPNHLDMVLLSTDHFIEVEAKIRGVSYNDVHRELIRPAEKALKESRTFARERGKDVIYDQTNLSRKARRKKLTNLPHHEKIAVFLDVEIDTILERNQIRKQTNRHLPLGTLNDMIRFLEIPLFDEGFSRIITVKNGVTISDVSKS